MTSTQRINLSKALSYTLKSMPRGKNYIQPIVNSCNLPYRHVSIDYNSDCFLCGCEGWLPIPVGKVSDFDSLEDIWNSPTAKMLQQDIDDKKFTWCAVEHCGIVNHNINRSTYSLSINIDDSCNLACPSCRREMKMLEKGDVFDNKVSDLSCVLDWLEKFEHPLVINIGSTGDPFASSILRNIIRDYGYKPGQKFQITTNGLLLKKLLPGSALMSTAPTISISVDAGSAEVYEKVRRPGKWEILIENLVWLSENRGHSCVNLNFVVQYTNYRDLPKFIELCRRFNFGGNVTPLSDWGTWNSRSVINPDAYTIANGTYLDHDVANVQHPAHLEFVDILIKEKSNNHSFIQFSSYFDRYNKDNNVSG